MCSVTVKKHLTFHFHHVSIGWTTQSSIQWRLPCPFIMCNVDLITVKPYTSARRLSPHSSFGTHSWALMIPQEPMFGANSSVNHDRTWYSSNTSLLRNLHFTSVYLLNHWSPSVQPVGSQSPSNVRKLSLQKGEKDLPRIVMSFIRENEIRI